MSECWATNVVQDSAFAHAFARAGSCTGWTSATSGTARCGQCGWCVSARLEDVGGVASGRFALIALSYVGNGIAAARAAVATELVLAVLGPLA